MDEIGRKVQWNLSVKWGIIIPCSTDINESSGMKMYENDIKKMQMPCHQEEFLSYIYEGYSKFESLARMKIAPIALDLACESDSQFQARLYRAEAFHADKMTDKLYTIHEDFEDPRMVAAVSDNFKWLAKHRKRDRYGEKVEHNVNPVNITVAISDARKRVSKFIDGNALILNDKQTDNISVERGPPLLPTGKFRPYVDPLS